MSHETLATIHFYPSKGPTEVMDVLAKQAADVQCREMVYTSRQS